MPKKSKEMNITGLDADCQISIRKVIHTTEKGEKQEEGYILRITAFGRLLLEEYHTLGQILKRKFLRGIGVELQNEQEFYKQFRKALLQMQFLDEYISYVTPRNGLQKIKGKWMYVSGNGSIDAQGFQLNIKSKMGGFYFPPDKVFEKQEYRKYIDKLLDIYRASPTVFYILFFMNIMGITNGYFRQIGEENFMRITLWLDGASGSGKTELAKAGVYAFDDSEFERKVFVSATGKRKEVLTMLIRASGGVVIVDDVKKEDVRERKNSVKNIIDDCIRSVFQGCLTDTVSGYPDCKKIDCCAIITGEYLETKESQNARMLYLNVDGFLKNADNAKALRSLQEDPQLLASVCGGYIQFLLRNMEEIYFKELVKSKLREVRAKQRVYKGIRNAERLNENECMLEMAAWLTETYFKDIGLQDELVDEFSLNAGDSIEEVIDATFYILGGAEMIFFRAMESVLANAKVRNAGYREERGYMKTWKYRQIPFWIDKEQDDFIRIEDYAKSMQERDQETYCKNNGEPVLLIRKERLEELYRKEIDNLLKEKSEISSRCAEKAITQFWDLLRERQVIYQKTRQDSRLGRTATGYPAFVHYTSQEVYGGKGESWYMVTFENAVWINTEHQFVEKLLDRLKRPDSISRGEDYYKVYDKEGKEIKEVDIYDIRRKFIKNKTLFKK